MADYKIITEATVYQNGSYRVRLNPSGGELRIEKYILGSWVYAGGFAGIGAVNEWRWIVDGSQLKVQQLISGGSWSGVEGVDFNTITAFNEL